MSTRPRLDDSAVLLFLGLIRTIELELDSLAHFASVDRVDDFKSELTAVERNLPELIRAGKRMLEMSH